MKKFKIFGALAVMALCLIQFSPAAVAGDYCNPFPECKLWPDSYPDETNEPNLPPEYDLFELAPEEGTEGDTRRKCQMRPWVCKPNLNSDEEKTGDITTPDPGFMITEAKGCNNGYPDCDTEINAVSDWAWLTNLFT